MWKKKRKKHSYECNVRNIFPVLVRLWAPVQGKPLFLPLLDIAATILWPMYIDVLDQELETLNSLLFCQFCFIAFHDYHSIKKLVLFQMQMKNSCCFPPILALNC